MHVLSLAWEVTWIRVWKPTLVFLPGEAHGQRSWQSTVHRVTRVRQDLVTKPPGENIKNQRDLKDTLTKVKNILEWISSRLDDTQEWICEMEDRGVQITLAFVCFHSKKRNELKMRILFKWLLGNHPAYKLSYSRDPRRRSKK